MNKKKEEKNQKLLGLDEKDLELIGVSTGAPEVGVPLLILKKGHDKYKGIGKKAEKLEKGKIGSKLTNKSILHGLKKIFKRRKHNKKLKNKKVKK